jgi:hypothetical protein
MKRRGKAINYDRSPTNQNLMDNVVGKGAQEVETYITAACPPPLVNEIKLVQRAG